MATVTISLPESLKQFVEGQISSKGYGNVSEYFRGLVREAQTKEEDARLEKLLLEGIASGESVPLDKTFWKEIKADVARLAKARRPEKKPA